MTSPKSSAGQKQLKQSKDSTIENRLAHREATFDGTVDLHQDQGPVIFEVHIDPTTKKITTSRFMCGKDRYRVQQVGHTIIAELTKKYTALDYIVMSSDEADGIWVWVRSRRAIPPLTLTHPNKTLNDDPIIDIPAHEVHNHRIENRPKLQSGDRRDDVIDI